MKTETIRKIHLAKTKVDKERVACEGEGTRGRVCLHGGLDLLKKKKGADLGMTFGQGGRPIRMASLERLLLNNQMGKGAITCLLINERDSGAVPRTSKV